MQTRSMANHTIKHDNNLSNVKYSSYMLEISNRIIVVNDYRKKLDILSVNSWNHRGEKLRSFTESLLNCIELYWDNIFDNDCTKLNIKGRVVNSISGFLYENQSLCEHSWILIVKQYINESIHNIYNYNNDGDILETKQQYLNNLVKFKILFNHVLSKYKQAYSIRKTNYICKYKFMTSFEYIRPVFLQINRDYYKLFDFSNSRKSFLKSLLEQAIGFIQTINEILICLKKYNLNNKEREYLILVRSSLQKTCKLFESKYSKFIGLVLTRLFYKDIALHITEYL